MALLALVAVVFLAGSYTLVKALNTASSQYVVRNAETDARALDQAKAALLAYIAKQTLSSAEVNPGRLPCPESLSDAGGANEGQPASYSSDSAGLCSGTVVVGRLPWKALGIDKLLDASGEPLWYAVAPSWVRSSATSYLTINSNEPSTGGLTLDGGDVVAVIIAPGSASSGQSRTAPNGVTALVASNYLDGENASPLDTTFIKSSTVTTFNDRAVGITRAEVLQMVEASIAARISSEIAPLVKDYYSTNGWSLPRYPFPGTFADPSSATFGGAIGRNGGLLPLVYSETYPKSGVACSGSGRCQPTFVAWQSASLAVTITGQTVYSPSCTVSGTALSCTYNYRYPNFSTPTYTVTATTISNATASNVGMSFRQVNATVSITGLTNYIVSAKALDTSGNGVLTIRLPTAGATTYTLNSSSGTTTTAATCGLSGISALINSCRRYSISVPIRIFADADFLDARDSATNAWFFRNKWHEVLYYAVASGMLPGGGGSCTTGTDCLQVSYPTSTATNARALMVLAGRTLTGATRPNATKSDWFESTNALIADSTTAFLGSSVTSPSATSSAFNDRVMVIDSN